MRGEREEEEWEGSSVPDITPSSSFCAVVEIGAEINQKLGHLMV